MVACKVLIIDDDEDDIQILAEAFTESGVESVHYVHSALKAFMYLQEVEQDCLPKLIVTDLYLPGITGAEFLKDLKAMEKYKHIHVIVLASVKSETEIQLARELGAIDYLVKPSSYDEYVKVALEIKRKAEMG